MKVQGPNGIVVDFPDGTDDATVGRVMQQAVGGQKAASKPPGMVTGLARSAAQGIPILGGLANKAEAGLEAAVAPYVEPLLPEGVGQRVNAPTFGERYGKALNIQNTEDEAFAREHPIASTAAEIGGGIASTGGAALTGTGGLDTPCIS